MRGLTVLFAIILLMALAGYVLRNKVRWFSSALLITSVILGAVLILSITGII